MNRKISLKKYLYKNKTTIVVYFVLRALVVFSMIRSFLRDDYESVFLGGLTLVMLIIPSFLSHKLKLEFPTTFEVFVLLFIFAAEILGEINNFYIHVPHCDAMLHTINGFLCAALGFALVAFCFSMTVGILWEFFEYAGDSFFALDMQKDTIVHTINTVKLDASNTNTVIHVKDIEDVILVYSDGTQEALGLGGYMDIGIIDTMQDLLVNLIGAIVFSVIGYMYLKRKGKGRFASKFIPQVSRNENVENRLEEA